MDRNELAYISGGRPRVALAALVTLVLDERLRMSHAGRLYTVQGAGGGDPVEVAALAQRSTLREALAALAEHESVLAVEEDVLRRGLVARRWFGLARRPTEAGKSLIEEARKGRLKPPLRVALDGVAAISDDKVRRQFSRVAKNGGSLRGRGTGGWSDTGATIGHGGGGDSSSSGGGGW